jgi:hypothetical protein
MQSPGRGEKHHRHDDLKPDEARDSLFCEFLHDLKTVSHLEEASMANGTVFHGVKIARAGADIAP